MDDGLLDIVQMATRLRVRVVWLRGQAESGSLPGAKLDHCWWFDPNAVDAAVRALAGIASLVDAERPVLVSAATLAAQTGWSERSIRELVAAGKMWAFTFGSRVLLEREYALSALYRMFVEKNRAKRGTHV